jgi:hypothetical protein
LGLLLLIAGTLSADVVVLKNGTKVAGRVVDKGVHYEVTTDAGLRTFLRDEVEDVLASPKELLGDVDKTFEQAKQQYTEALALQDPSERNAKLKDAIDKVRVVRETLASTRELFPEDKYADLDQKLMHAMQLMRLLRERVTVDLAKKSDIINPRPSAATAATMSQALATLADPALRADASKRAAARDSFKIQRADYAEVHDLATAAVLFLGRSDADWRLNAAGLKALQEYFAKPWMKDATKLAPAAHLEAAAWLAAQIAAIRKIDQGRRRLPELPGRGQAALHELPRRQGSPFPLREMRRQGQVPSARARDPSGGEPAPLRALLRQLHAVQGLRLREGHPLREVQRGIPDLPAV